MKYFSVAGPIQTDIHYGVPPLARQGLEDVERLIDDRRWFVLHAPRQTGKTSALLALGAHLRGRGLRAVYANIETAQTARNDVTAGMQAIVAGIIGDASIQGLPPPAEVVAAARAEGGQHGEHAWPIGDYREAEVQLVMQAYLQRVVNGEGYIEREYGLGRGRADLFVRWPYSGGEQRFVIEVKVQRGTREAVVAEGLPQIAAYADRCRADAAHLVIFDRRQGISWDEKVFHETREHAGRRVVIWGM